MHSFLSRIIVFTIALALPLTAFADNAVGRPSGGGVSIEWQTRITGHERIQLTVIGPDGEVYVRDFGPGRNPSFRLQDVGGVAADGQYSYELRVLPKISADVQKRLKSARAANDDTTIRKISREAGLGSPLTQSGTITILNGSFVDPNAVEGSGGVAVASTRGMTSDGEISRSPIRGGANPAGSTPVRAFDQVIADDLIVTGSVCVGFDCVDGESFGFDTIRMKENNTQINFDDTSTSSGFPSNDWRLIANDSTSGGANKFVVNDATAARNLMTITAAAPADSLFVASTGKVGFRQAAPALDLHVTTNDTPAMRYEQSSAGGFAAQTWDVAGNEANFFVRDVTGGSKLPFRIRPGAPTSSIDITATGNVGVGLAGAGNKLDVQAATRSGAHNTTRPLYVTGDIGQLSTGAEVAHSNGTAGVGIGWGGLYAFGSVTDLSLSIMPKGSGNFGIGVATPTFQIHHSSGARLDGGVWTNASSRELKENIQALDSEKALEALNELDPVTFVYKSHPNDPHVGFIAEEVPEIVATPDRKALASMDVVAVLTKVVKEQQKTIDALNKRLQDLESQQK